MQKTALNSQPGRWLIDTQLAAVRALQMPHAGAEQVRAAIIALCLLVLFGVAGLALLGLLGLWLRFGWRLYRAAWPKDPHPGGRAPHHRQGRGGS